MQSTGAERRLRELRDELEQEQGVLRPHFYGVARASEQFTHVEKADGIYIRLADGAHYQDICHLKGSRT